MRSRQVMWRPRLLITSSSAPRSGSPFLRIVAKSPLAAIERTRAEASTPAGSRSSGGVALIRPHQHGGQRVAAARAAHLVEAWPVAREAADRGQRLQMLGPRIGRRKQQEHEVDRPPVDRLIVDRLGEPQERAGGMRYGAGVLVQLPGPLEAEDVEGDDDGLALGREILRRWPQTGIVVVTVTSSMCAAAGTV